MPKDDEILIMIEVKFILKYMLVVFKFFFYKKGEQTDITKSNFDMWKFTKFIGMSLIVTCIFVLGSKLVYLAKSNLALRQQLVECRVIVDKK